MDDRCIAIVDSGIGGLNVLKKLKDKYPLENYVYFSDGKNIPYGNKTQNEIEIIAKENVKRLTSFCVKLIVFACNTLSVSTVGMFKGANVTVLGVTPIVEKQGKGLLLCTQKTAKSNYVKQLVEGKNVEVFALEGLAEEIERSVGCKRVDLTKWFSVVDCDYDYVSLGCTHYPFLLDEFKILFPKSKIISGEEQLLSKIDKVITTCNPDRKSGEVLFIGESKEKAKWVYKTIF